MSELKQNENEIRKQIKFPANHQKVAQKKKFDRQLKRSDKKLIKIDPVCEKRKRNKYGSK